MGRKASAETWGSWSPVCPVGARARLGVGVMLVTSDKNRPEQRRAFVGP